MLIGRTARTVKRIMSGKRASASRNASIGAGVTVGVRSLSRDNRRNCSTPPAARNSVAPKTAANHPGGPVRNATISKSVNTSSPVAHRAARMGRATRGARSNVARAFHTVSVISSVFQRDRRRRYEIVSPIDRMIRLNAALLAIRSLAAMRKPPMVGDFSQSGHLTRFDGPFEKRPGHSGAVRVVFRPRRKELSAPPGSSSSGGCCIRREHG